MLTADQMRALPDVFTDLPDPRRAQGRRHRRPTVLALAAAAVLCGMRGYQARQRFRCRRSQDGRYLVPSESIFRDCLIRVDPVPLDRALQRWNAIHGATDHSLAIDGKTMCNALDGQGRQTHIMSAVGHHTKTGYTPKKSAPCR
jgi:hypothetical protein